MKIEVIDFDPEHLKKIQVQEYQQGECPKTILTVAFTLVRGDEIIAILGGFPFVPGVIHFWALLSESVRKYPLDFHKTCLKVIKWYEQNEKPRRIQFEVRANYPMGCKWAESLGMEREGLMKKWAPDGSDCYLYARVNTCQP